MVDPHDVESALNSLFILSDLHDIGAIPDDYYDEMFMAMKMIARTYAATLMESKPRAEDVD